MMHPPFQASRSPFASVDESRRLILAALEGTVVALQHPGKLLILAQISFTGTPPDSDVAA